MIRALILFILSQIILFQGWSSEFNSNDYITDPRNWIYYGPAAIIGVCAYFQFESWKKARESH